jgi:glycosyltransferase involved in cell wall biosynthesis
VSREHSITVAIPVLNESAHIDACLAAIAAQTHPVAEILVADGGSTDDTRARAAAHPGARVLDNPRRMQSAGLNVALSEAKGDIFVRVDGHCVVAPDYVERCVQALDSTGAAMVGGGMRPVGDNWFQRGVATAMMSRLGAGPAHFHAGTNSRWVDTVYLGAFRTEVARNVGGYAEDVGVNEDAELAYRMGRVGGVWFESTVSSSYTPRGTVRAVVRQFYRYGRSRAATVRKHPDSLAPRQLAPAALVLSLATPLRRRVGTAYAIGVVGRSAAEVPRDPAAAVAMAAVLPAMHLSWGVGFLEGLFRAPPGSRPRR